MEKIVENKKCKQCNSKFKITDSVIEFYKKLSPQFKNGKGKKEVFEIPISKLCSNCAEQNRLSFVNRRKLYKRKCDATGKSIISIYSPDKEIKVYDKTYWWSDNWEALDYGREVDFISPIFKQFYELTRKVPYPNLTGIGNENSDYNNSIYFSKNCYMSFGGRNFEDSYYIDESMNVKYSSDLWWSGNIEKSYECFNCANLYNCKFCYNCDNSSNLIFCKECINCQDCFMCYGLQNKKYCILNIEYTKEEYKEKLENIDLGSYKNLNFYLNKFKEFELKQIHKASQTSNNQNCLGDYIYNSKDCYNCFNVVDAENAINLYEGGRVKNVVNSSFIYDDEGSILGSVSVFDNCFNILFSEYIYNNSSNIIYSSNLESCKNCFLCVGLRYKEYCILNKQYTKKEYTELSSKIIKYMEKTGEWGEFFPSNISKFGYNETIASENFYLMKQEVLKQGFNWSDYKKPEPNVTKIIPAEKLPDNIKDIPDDILNWAIKCEVSGKLFRIVKGELKFYKKHSLPIPRKHPDLRYLERMKLRNPRKLWARKCNKCGIDIKTTYSLEREEIIYCEECYKKFVY